MIMTDFSVQLCILLLIILIFALGTICLICLSYFTTWPRRVESYFLAVRKHYKPKGAENIDSNFSTLLLHDEMESSRWFRYTKPEVYLTIVVPAFNEELRLPLMLNECLKYLEERAAEESEFTYELIVVDDGSSDTTADVAFSFSKHYPIFVYKLAQNIGKGGSVREGVLCARGQFILFADADGATKFSDLEKLERQMKTLCNGENSSPDEPTDWTHPAIVVGSRAHLEKEAIATRSSFRTILMIGFHTLVWIFTVRSIRDTQCGFKMFSRSAAAKLFTQLHIERWAFDVELIFLAERQHFSLAEVAVEWTEIDGSKVTPIFSWLQMGRDIMLIWFRYSCGIWKIGDI